jgi:hypothetical protein
MDLEGESFDAGRDWHVAQGGFARGSRWFCMQPEVDLHANHGFSHRSRWF